MKNKLLKYFIVIIILCVLVLFCPFPKPVVLSFQGTQFNKGIEQESVEITLHGWELDYLFKTNQLHATFTIYPYSLNSDAIFNVKIDAPILVYDNMKKVQFDFYCKEKNEMIIGTLDYSKSEMLYHDNLNKNITFRSPKVK